MLVPSKCNFAVKVGSDSINLHYIDVSGSDFYPHRCRRGFQPGASRTPRSTCSLSLAMMTAVGLICSHILDAIEREATGLNATNPARVFMGETVKPVKVQDLT